MDGRRPAIMSLLQLIDALGRCVDPAQHSALIREALEQGGLSDVPAERAEFRAFVSGPLQLAAQRLLGDRVATELTWTLMRMTSLRAPSSHAPRSGPRGATLDYTDSRSSYPSPRGDTVEYTGDVFAPRLDVMVIDPDEELFEELRIHLEARDYRIARRADVMELEGFMPDAPPSLVIANVELDEGVRIAEQLPVIFRTNAPRVVVLTHESETPPPVSVDRVLPRGAMAPIVEAVMEMVGPRS